MLAHKQMRIGELTQQLLIAQIFPKPDFSSAGAARASSASRSSRLQKKKLQLMLKKRQAHRAELQQRPGRPGVRPECSTRSWTSSTS